MSAVFGSDNPFDFTVVQTGPIGPTGPQGIPGKDGTDGIDGAQGIQGVQGLAGKDGAQGEQGVQGEIGPIGPTGPEGPEGPQGKAGVQGPQGESAIASLNYTGFWSASRAYTAATDDVVIGTDGNSYVCIADNIGVPPSSTTTDQWVPIAFKGATGETGPEGPTGATGPAGADGPQGIQGIQGPPGKDGTNGVDGAEGPQGIQGLQGPPGVPGVKGDNGNDGATGPTGATGPEGPPGPTGPTGAPGAAGQDANVTLEAGAPYHLHLVKNGVAQADVGIIGIGTVAALNTEQVLAMVHSNQSGQVKVRYTNLQLVGFTSGTNQTMNVRAATAALSDAPTTIWPAAAVASGTNTYEAGVFIQGSSASADRFVENNTPGQVHRWRVAGNYSNKTVGNQGRLRCFLLNPDTNFKVSANVVLPSGVDTDDFTFEFTSIADNDSLATGRGYVIGFQTTFDDPTLTVQVNSIVRISEAIDGGVG